MKKILSLVLALIMMLSVSVPAFAAEVSYGDVAVKVVKTWENEAGETVTGIISKAPVLSVCTTSENEARGIITVEQDTAAVAAYDDNADVAPLNEVSDYFFFQIKNNNDVVVSTYQVKLTGKITAFSRKITAVKITYVSGNTCTTSYEINGNSAYVVVTHPTLGYLDGTFTLNWDGSFTVT